MTKNKPQVSIGMPIYNAEKYLKEAIDSLLSQSFKDFELIISDNASTDSTHDICMEYAKKEKERIQKDEKKRKQREEDNPALQKARRVTVQTSTQKWLQNGGIEVRRIQAMAIALVKKVTKF